MTDESWIEVLADVGATPADLAVVRKGVAHPERLTAADVEVLRHVRSLIDWACWETDLAGGPA